MIRLVPGLLLSPLILLAMAAARFRKAAKAGDVAAVARQLETNPCLCHSTDGEDCTALFRASEQGQVAVVSLLVQHRADRNERQKCGSTPLDAALYWAKKHSLPGGDQQHSKNCHQL